MRRILKEVEDAVGMFSVTQVNDYLYKVEILGPPDSLYEDVNITLYYEYKIDHPFSYPAIMFYPPLFHPNVDEKGFLRISALERSHAETLLSDMVNVVSLLYEPHVCEIVISEKGKEEIREGYEQEVTNPSALHLWRNDQSEFKSFVYSSRFL
jgi:ubiquitin-protein ligase